MTIAGIDGYKHEVFELTVKEDLTIHDATYLHYATKNKLILVTGDARLRESRAVRRDHDNKRTRVETITTTLSSYLRILQTAPLTSLT